MWSASREYPRFRRNVRKQRGLAWGGTDFCVYKGTMMEEGVLDRFDLWVVCDHPLIFPWLWYVLICRDALRAEAMHLSYK